MVPNCAYGIDLGTSNIKIYSLSDDSVMMEKNMIAIENKKNIFAYGNSAYEMYEKAPANIQISHPLSNGVIADINNMERLIHLFISDMSKGNIRPADFYIAVPTDITEVEKRAFYDLIKDANVKARKIMVVEKAIADGLGMDIDVKKFPGCPGCGYRLRYDGGFHSFPRWHRAEQTDQNRRLEIRRSGSPDRTP